jgi:hypothetical protein
MPVYIRIQNKVKYAINDTKNKNLGKHHFIHLLENYKVQFPILIYFYAEFHLTIRGLCSF